MWIKRALWMISLAGWLPFAAVAGEVDVTAVSVDPQGGDRFSFSVELSHADEGWEHYADRWDVVSLDGKTVYGERVLHHPHVNEQPFTRSLSGVAIPPDVREVLVRGHDKVHKLGGVTMTVVLPGR